MKGVKATMIKTKKVLKITVVGFVLLGVFGAIALGVLVLDIRKSVLEKCAAAQKAHPHPGDDVAALIDYMNSQEHSFPERNSAIWVLGRLRSTGALPALQAVYTGGLCDHKSNLCQYELAKAIRRCGGTPTPPPKTGH